MRDNTLSASLDLLSMDIAFGRGKDILVELSKALTIAQQNSGVEARVICKNMLDLFTAHHALDVGVGPELGFTWNKAESVYELSNGSCIRVVSEATK